MTATAVVRALTIVVFVAVATVACRQALRQRDRAAWWIFASFAVIAGVTVTLALLPDESDGLAVAVVRRVTLATLPLFPYFLFRFTAALTPPAAWLRTAATVLTALTAAAALVGTGASLRSGGTSSVYQVVLLVQWTLLSAAVAWRLWRAGRGEPTVARRRMRTLSVGALGLTIPLLLVGAAPDGAAIAVVIRSTALASALLFLVALAPPPPLRVRWRRAEEARLRVAVSELMAATTPEQVTATLLPHVAAVLGARGAALLADDGEVLAAHPPDVAAGDPDSAARHPRIDVVRLVSGRLSVYASPYTPLFGREELDLLANVGGLADLALQRCKHLGIAEMLQRSLLPDTLPELPGVRIEGRYLPSDSGAIGGDWYDVIPLPDGRVGLAIGDVMGHGVEAAALMGHLRSALRAYALDGTSPVTVLSRLDVYLERLHVNDMATVLYVVVEPGSGSVQLASAGHPPPLVRTADGSVSTLPGGLGPPLGLFRSALPTEAATTVPPECALILFTDGLVERRGEAIDDGFARLRDVVARPHPPAVSFADHVITGLLHDGAADDVALLVAEFVAVSGSVPSAAASSLTATSAPIA